MPRANSKLRQRALSALASFGVGLIPLIGSASSAAAQDVSSQQWYLNAMQAEGMWGVSKGKSITVAVIDTGVNAEVPELRGQVLKGVDVSRTPTDVREDKNGHGTNMAALIAGTGAGDGIQGLAPGAKVLPIKAMVSGSDVAGPLMAKAIRYAVDHGARVLNISLGSAGVPSQFNETQHAVDYALKKGALVFAAVGNTGDAANSAEFPASLRGVVGVGAIDREGKAAKFSTTGNQVALVAVGSEIVGHCLTKAGSMCMSRGTSQATAIASASAALIWSKHPKWTNNQVLRVMMQTAAKPESGEIPSSYVGYGSIRPRKVLLDGEGDPGPANVNPLLAREGATKPAPSASASASKSPSSDPQSTPTATDDKKGDNKTVAESKKNDDNSSTLWIAIGVGIAVLLAAAVAIVLVRRRGSASVGL
ncbi:type VII secretion-associated serine protease mycosin [Streptomyces sp. NPDC059679]|uniref:type VII secretion-associated serine protease mycosin n=1 Tax=Streptomyces sp. NPDC059679 TaxID=3346903 RepID=UPI0036A079D8